MLGLIIKKRNIAAGAITYGERIQLEEIFRKENIDDIERTKEIIECLHGIRVSTFRARLLLPYALEICNAFVDWIEKEKKLCTIEPQQEALQAGIEELNSKVGNMGSVVSFAERFGFTFEQVFKMPYMDVFTIWMVDAATAAYNRRLNKVLESKYKSS